MQLSCLARLHTEPAIRRIAVVRALQFGDLLCTVPALRALRTAFPTAEITLVGLPWARSFVERFDRYLDHLLEFPGYPGLPEQPPRLPEIPGFFAAAQALRFDLALQMHGSGQVLNPITVLLGARRNAGYYLPGQYCPDETLFMPYPDGEPEVRVHLRLMEFLGIPVMGEHLEYPLSADDRRSLEALPEVRELQAGGYVCIHPGARYPSRRWPADRFAAVADALAARGLRVVITGSTEEADLTAAVAALTQAVCVDLGGKTDPGGLGALLGGARLVVCNDTGVSHVAAGLRVPSVVVASGSDVHRWAPLDTTLHRVLWQDVPCRPCGYFECPIDHPCATGVTVGQVLLEAERLLAETAGRFGGAAHTVTAAPSRKVDAAAGVQR